MDNMAAGWERPQEDEFALMNLGQPSPYRRMAFPNEPPVDLDYLCLSDVDDIRRHEWIETLRRFLLRVSLSTQRPLIIKSPTHTGRLLTLARQFPEAKFIHLTRNPRELFPSTCRLWKSLDEAQGLQLPDHDQVKEYVLRCFESMYEAFHRDRPQVADHRVVDLRYEDLIADPVSSLRQVYESLRLADFESVEEDIRDWVRRDHGDYQSNRHQLSDEDEATIRSRWSEYFERYEYT